MDENTIIEEVATPELVVANEEPKPDVKPVTIPDGINELDAIRDLIHKIRFTCTEMGIRDSEEALNLVESMKAKARLVLLAMSATVDNLK